MLRVIPVTTERGMGPPFNVDVCDGWVIVTNPHTGGAHRLSTTEAEALGHVILGAARGAKAAREAREATARGG